MDDMQEIMDDFFVEADESLDELEQDLIKLETVCDTGDFDGDLVDRIFRVLHTLKGGAGFLGLERMAKLAHAGENLLDDVRAGKVTIDIEVMDALLKTNDLLKELLELEKVGGDAETIEIDDIVATLEKLIGAGGGSAEPKAEEKPEAEPEVEAAPAEEAKEAPAVTVNEELLAEIAADDRLAGGEEEAEAAPAEEAKEAKKAPVVAVNEELLAEIAADDRLAGGEEEVEEAPAKEAKEAPSVAVNEDLLAEIAADDRLAGGEEEPAKEEVVEAKTEVVEEAEAVEEEAVVKRGQGAPKERREKEDRRKQPRRQAEQPEATIRVETGKLDKTMNLVGELVLARNSLVRFLNLPEMKAALDSVEYSGEILTNIEHLSQVTKDLQLSVLSTRMQAVKKVFDKIPRQVRDLKGKLDREVNLVIEGEYTEIDKSLVEELADPMVHLIRNSLDHGIEPPADREAVGKKRTGTLTIGAFYEGNKVVIQVKDDGAGIDPEKIRKIAVGKGMVTEVEAEALSDEDAVKLIMAPGFSTAEVISDVSGRGVGMDVVNSSIQEMKGSVDIVSEFGVGTTIFIYLPLTLAIVQALVVKSAEEGFAIPIGDINEVIKFNTDEVHKMNDQDVIELRGEVLPLFDLKELTTPDRQTFVTEDNVLKARVEEEVIEPTEPQEAKEVSEGVTEADADAVTEGSDSEKGEDIILEAVKETKVPQPIVNNDQHYVVVVKEGRQSLGVIVDELIGQEEAVIKALNGDFEYHSAISGATITGDGTVQMILDVPYLIKEISKK